MTKQTIKTAKTALDREEAKLAALKKRCDDRKAELDAEVAAQADEVAYRLQRHSEEVAREAKANAADAEDAGL